MDSVVFRKVCYLLKNAAPREWETFVEMFDAYTQNAIESVVDSNKDVILEAQGAAKQCRAILYKFKTCNETTASP